MIVGVSAAMGICHSVPFILITGSDMERGVFLQIDCEVQGVCAGTAIGIGVLI